MATDDNARVKDIVLLGSTGSIGVQALDIVRRNPDDYRVVALGRWDTSSPLSEVSTVDFISQTDNTFSIRLSDGLVGSIDIVAQPTNNALQPTLRMTLNPAAANLIEPKLVQPDTDSPIDLVVESVGGAASTLDSAVATCRPGGTICLLGVYTKSIPFPALFTVAKELTIKGSFVYNRAGSRADFDVTVDLLRRHGAKLGATMVTHRFPLERIAEAFETASDKTRGSIKVTITGR